MNLTAEYIWIDGCKPTAKLRSKTKILDAEPLDDNGSISLEIFPNWGFDGSSTEQAEGANSDCLLKPVRVVADPLREAGCYLVLCEVLSADGSPHPSNTRNQAWLTEAKFRDLDCWFGIEQEYTLYDGDIPLGWPSRGPANPQGKYYCGVGANEVFGREIVEEHRVACLRAGLKFAGINAEVMPGQWEFQIGPADALRVSDDLWLARYLLYRIAAKTKVTVRLDPKPLAGDWNGAGAHTNFSTALMRSKDPRPSNAKFWGYPACMRAADALGERFSVEGFPTVYGAGFEKRLTGLHETCSYKEFKYGVADRTASVRIPRHVSSDGCGYIEDRRPCANADPYQLVTYLMETICPGDG